MNTLTKIETQDRYMKATGTFLHEINEAYRIAGNAIFDAIEDVGKSDNIEGRIKHILKDFEGTIAASYRKASESI
jgi:hypothetical protein